MDTNQPRNLLLSSMSPPIIEDICAASELVHFDMRENIIEPNKTIGYVDFIESGVTSLISVMEDGSQIELALIGREGMLGLPLLLGVESVGQKIACQVDASALRLKAEDFLELVKRHPELGEICQRYAVAMFEQVALTIGCNRSHSIEKRYARWLLLTHDRCDSDNFTATQGFLASMLGVSRTGVNIAAGALLRAKLITYVRGKVTILDRKSLEESACQCYFAMCKSFENMMNISGLSK
ncbi:MAG: Crp/Fnr family transcriptional regulator [Candidatus Melainabacteria bacterium]|nr:Crp/Fnr family transcriptional regulator [Candidatus Melainabacteria bacterium]